MTKASPDNTATAHLAESFTVNIPVPADIENALLDLDGIGDLLLSIAAAQETGMLINPRSLYYLGMQISDRAYTLADDLGIKVFERGEDRP